MLYSYDAPMSRMCTVIRLLLSNFHIFIFHVAYRQSNFSVEKLDAYWNDVYVKPYVRCGPFIAGVLVGYLLIHFTQGQRGLRYKISRVGCL